MSPIFASCGSLSNVFTVPQYLHISVSAMLSMICSEISSRRGSHASRSALSTVSSICSSISFMRPINSANTSMLGSCVAVVSSVYPDCRIGTYAVEAVIRLPQNTLTYRVPAFVSASQGIIHSLFSSKITLYARPPSLNTAIFSVSDSFQSAENVNPARR